MPLPVPLSNSLILGLLTLLLLFVGRCLAGKTKRPAGTAKPSLKETRSIVDFSFAGVGFSREKRLVLRAIPNERLRRAFGINNYFTTTDFKVHRTFLRLSSNIIAKINNREQWREAYRLACSLVASSDSSYVKLASFVRNVCLRVVMHLLFATSVHSRAGNYQTSADEINAQWMASKERHGRDGTAAGGTSQALETALDNILASRVSEDGSQISAREALELLLPAYETLWRVVLLIFADFAHRRGSNRDGVAAFVANATQHVGIEGKETMARNMAKEGFRLYPSTKRVYRARSDQHDGQCGNMAAADVEAAHRKPAIWGPDAGVFRADRFERLTGLQQEAYFPFGLRPHVCPAKNSLGDRLIAVLVAALCASLIAEKKVLHLGNPLLDEDVGAALPTGRTDMEDWVLEEKG